MSTVAATHPSSYRDPSGFIFEKDGVLYRQVNTVFKSNFDHFISSGCYDALAKKGLLIPHQAIHDNLTGGKDWYITLLPEKINFISYPYEWSFDMLKDAALLTLQLIREAIPFGILLKDATPFNIQWHGGKLVFMDTLSFEKYDETQPWIAYRQFCECFLGPLLLAHYNKIPIHRLFLAYPEGIPLTVIKSLLPAGSRLSLYTYLHIFLHARVSVHSKNKAPAFNRFSKQKLLNLVASLETLVTKLKFTPQATAWSNYYEEALQRNDYLEEKKKIITAWISELPGIMTCIDLGANDGEFSQLPARLNIMTLSADADPDCINSLYKKIKSSGEINMQPLIIDLSDPSAATGVNNEERQSFLNRADADLVLALALVHHLAIGKNIPFGKIADLFSRITKILIIEFVPKQDPKIKLMLNTKKDIYDQYTADNFENEFKRCFSIEKKQEISETGRILYCMKRV